jgi:1-acyl-sn-glycerol-3-phosphate acyltransferase
MTEPYIVPLYAQVARSILRPIFKGVFYLLAKIEVYGYENVPTQGAYLVCVNHVSLFEPPFLLAFWPVMPEAAGAAEIWERPLQATLAKLYGGIPVHRGQYDRKLLEAMLAVLYSGKPLLIAPEGSRSHTPGLRRGLPGVAYVIEKTGVPVVPVGVTGADDDFLKRALRLHRSNLKMRIGKPFYVPGENVNGKNRHEIRQQNVDYIMKRIAELLPPEYQGVYG